MSVPASHNIPGNWNFHNPVSVHVGRGCRAAFARESTGQALLVVTIRRGRRQFEEDVFLRDVAKRNDIHCVDSVEENPGLDDLQSEIDQLAGCRFDAVVGFGGGSALDAAKVLNVALASECRSFCLSDLLFQPRLHENSRPAPLYTLPTTSGTGSEVTLFATVWDHKAKKSSLWLAERFGHTKLTWIRR